jgi:hypothetical protein
LAYRIETNLAVFNRRVRLFDDGGALVLWMEQRKQYSPPEVVIEGPEGPVIHVLSRTVMPDDPQYELFLVATGASLGFLRRSGDILSPGYEDAGKVDDEAIVLAGRAVARLDRGRVELTSAGDDLRVPVLALAMLRSVPELWLAEWDD